MKYIFYTIVVFFLVLVQVSFLGNIHGVLYLTLAVDIPLAYYIARHTKLAIFLVFISGILLDVFHGSLVGVTSTNACIALLSLWAIERIVPSTRVGTVIGVVVASVVFFVLTYVFKFGISLSLLSLLPWVVCNAVIIYILQLAIGIIKPAERERKIRMS